MNKILKIFICFSAIYAVVCSAFSEITVNAMLSNVLLPSGITSDQLEDELNDLIKENSHTDAAVCAAVVSKGQTLSEKISGHQDIENGIMADQSTVYEWGSLTKVLTWISVMQLEEQGKIDLKMNIEAYLPANYLKKLKYNTRVNMLDLMNHTGGWQDSITDVYTDDADDVVSLEKYVSKHEPPQIYEPGTTTAYSNWGVTLAGLIVERVSGQSYIDYVNKNIFEPLEMSHTSIDPMRNDNSFVKENINKVKGYTTQGKEIKGSYYAPDYPAAGAAGTLGDAVILMKAMLSDPSPIFENEETLKKILTPTNNYLNTDHPEIAHGLWYDSYATETLGHSGNTAQFSTHMSLDPVSGTGVVVMTNQAQEMTFTVGVGNIVFGKTYPENVPDDEWKEHNFLKKYVCARTIEKGYCSIYNFFQVYKVTKTDENKLLISSPMMKLPCTRIAEDAYVVDSGFLEGYKIYADSDKEGKVRRMGIYTFDMIEYSDSKYINDTIVFIAAGIAFFLALTAVVLSIREYKRKKECMALFRTGINILTILFFAVIFMEIFKLTSTTASTGDMIPFIAFYALYVLAGILFTAVSIVKKQKNKITCITVYNILSIIYFILHWQMLTVA